ncbi:MAG: DUF2461 domain-containing protein [Alphaproteobacteria bacterium]|jgi:uncharacterized protein (TIGR02453 family)|nr:DUF2461 domain-containing protein [Alphaproteobacteria bacterium]
MKIIRPEVLKFFNELEKNNNRDWFDAHKPRFKANEAEVKSFASALHEVMNEHDRVDSFKLFRVYRDVRFSKDKTPYKTHFGISFHREKPRFRGGYYLHLKSGNNFIAAGFWNPSKEDLLRIRKELEFDAAEFRAIMANPSFSSVWGELEGEEVKSAPRNFSKDNPNIDLIKKKAYLFTKRYSDKELLAQSFFQQVSDDFKVVRPFFDYMSSVLTTDLNGVSLLPED